MSQDFAISHPPLTDSLISAVWVFKIGGAAQGMESKHLTLLLLRIWENQAAFLRNDYKVSAKHFLFSLPLDPPQMNAVQEVLDRAKHI